MNDIMIYMKKRVFIAINLPDEIKRDLLSHVKRWPNLKVKWTHFSNMHITMEFLGNVDRKELDTILLAVQNSCCDIKKFNLSLERIVLGPDENQPSMFWATIHIDQNIMNLKKVLDANLESCEFNLEKREFKPHITLARAKGNQLKGKKTNISLRRVSFCVSSIDVMQSQLHPGGSRYKSVGSFRLS